MMYPALSALLSGSLMYYLGSQQQQPQQKVTQQQVSIQQPELKTKTLMKDTFNLESITPILRTFYISERCYLIYSTLHKAPLAVHELLDKNIITGDAPRKKTFYQDENIKPEKFAVNNDYYSIPSAYGIHNFHRGHMAGAGNYSGNIQMKYATFTYANTIPQNASNNTGIWNTFERYSRDLLNRQKCKTIQIISGPIYYSDKKFLKENGDEYENVYKNEEKVMLKNGIIVPPRLYKIIKCNTQTKSYTSGFTFYNSQTFDNEKAIKDFEKSLQEIQDLTGLQFNFKGDESLTSFDNEATSKTKLFYDTNFYSSMLRRSTTIKDFSSSNKRAKEQKIYLDMKDYSDLIEELVSNDLKTIRQADYSDCRKLNTLLSLHKSLYYLYSLKPYHQAISDEIETKIIPCDQSDDKAFKGYIKKKVQKKTKYYYPYQERLRELFGEKKVEASQEK